MSLPSFNLDDKVALITGASRGIGLAIAQAYALAGAKVVLSSRKQDALDLVAEDIRKSGGEALAVAAHTGDDAAIKALISQVTDTYGGVDILVNNAATNPHFGPLITAEESHWDKTLDVNIKGYFRMIKACVESMRQRGGGKIINVASISGLQAQGGMGIYAISKAGVIMMTKVMALELAHENIQVNAIAPGVIKTQFSRVLWSPSPLSESVLKGIPQGRFGLPEELNGIALYLASSASDFTTGAVFTVDGGQTAGNRMP